MKFEQELKTNIITTDDEYATLENMDNGIYRYLVTFCVDPKLALQAKASTVNIYVSKDPNFQTNIPIFNTATAAFAGKGIAPMIASQAVTQLLQRSSVIKDVVRAADQNTILSVRTDFTSRIPNNMTQQLARSDNSNPVVLNSVRSFTSVPVTSLRTQNLNVPILERSLANSPVNPEDTDVGNLKHLAQDLLINRNIDPASLMVRENAIVNSRKSFGGITQKINTKHLLADIHKPLLTSLHASAIVKPTMTSLPPNAVVSVPAVSNVSNVLMQEYIDIPYGSIPSEEFYFIFEMKSGSGLPIQRLVKPVAHGKNVAALMTPKIPPILNAVSSDKIGKNTLEIKQIDTNALGVNLYRKIFKKNVQQVDAGYTFIGKIPLTTADGYKTVDDLVANANPIIYRAIPYGQNDKISAEFGSVVAKSVKMPYKSGNSHRKASFATLSYEFTNSGIVVEISNIPPGPNSIVLFKQDLSTKQPVRYVDTPRALNSKGSETVVFKDTNVLKGRVYQYTYKFIYRDGQEEFGANSLTIEYTPETSNIVNTTIVNPRVVEQGNTLDVQFTLDSSFVDKGEDAVKNALTQQGLSQFFDSSIKQENLQNLIGYGIIRTNLTTGEVEDFGIITTKEFSDTKFGTVKNVKPVTSGYEYQYSVSTFFRSPITLLENYVANVVVESNQDRNYSYKPFEWLHPITLTEGNAVTPRSLLRNHAKTQFSFGEVGSITKTTLSVSSVLPSVYSATAIKINSKLIKIQWKVQGVATKIDHFIVMIEVLGMRSVVGKCHNISDSNYFEFFDQLTDGEKGALTYYLIPVYYDYSRGKEIQTNKVLL